MGKWMGGRVGWKRWMDATGWVDEKIDGNKSNSGWKVRCTEEQMD